MRSESATNLEWTEPCDISSCCRLVTTVGVSYTFNATRTDSLTPPYVSARPEVAVRDMNLPARFPFVPKAKGERLAFLVMGSDGREFQQHAG